MSLDLEQGFCLEGNEVRPSENCIVRGGITHKIEPKSMAVLVELARSAGETVPREQLLELVWPRGYVTDDVLNRSISRLRVALGDDRKSPVFIATIPRKGYRLLATVRPGPGQQARVEGILVFPFHTLAAAGEVDYLVDGLTELMIARLAVAVDQRVLSRTTSMALKNSGHGTQWIREKLGVKWMVEGSLFQSGNDLQIIVQLVDVQEDTPVWANTWTRPAVDFLSVLNEITRLVAIQIRQQVEPLGYLSEKNSSLPVELEARYLQGTHHLSRRSTPSLHKSIACFEDVLKNRPHHAQALAGLALAHVLLAHYGSMEVAPAMERAREYAGKALSIDPENAEALSHMGAVKFFYDWEFDEALRYIRASLEKQPNYEISLLLEADIEMVRGNSETSQALLDLAVATDPLNVGLLMNAGDLLILQRRYREAVRSLDQALEIEPDMCPSHLRRALALALDGSVQEARDSLETAYKIAGDNPMYAEYEAIVEGSQGNREAAVAAAERLQAMSRGAHQVSSWALARAWAAADDDSRAIGFLEQAFERRSTSMPFLGTSPVFERLRNQPRVANLLRKIG